MLEFAIQLALLSAFFFPVAALSYALAKRYTGAVKLAAAGIIFAWLLAFWFAVLMSTGGFSRLAAAGAGMTCWVIFYFATRPPGCIAHCLKNDFASFRNVIIGIRRDPAGRIAMVFFLLLAVLLAIRTLMLPVLGWDALTYHGLKAGLWVQTGTWQTFEAPGGWEYYRSYFGGGGEVFPAWTMLFFRSGIFAAIPDLGAWLFLGLCVAILARQYNLPRRPAALISLAFISAPEFSRMVGSGYIDTLGNALMLCGLSFVLRGAQAKRNYDLYIAAGALGLAASVKVNMLGAALLMAPVFSAFVLRNGKRSARSLLFCGILFALPVMTWLLYNFVATGFPLGSIPFQIGPLKLGEAPPNLLWFLDRPDLEPYRLRSELIALMRALMHYGPTILLSALGIPGLAAALWRRSAVHILGLCLIMVSAALFFSPSFAVVRLGWAGVNGRFLVPLVVLPAVMGLSAAATHKASRALIVWWAVVCIIINVCNYLKTFVLGGHRIELFFLGAAGLLVAAIYCVITMPRIGKTLGARTGLAAMLAISLIGLAACEQFRNWFRPRAYAACTTMHAFPRYWVSALPALDSAGGPATIAFAYGPQQVSHGAFLAPFLGPRLDNRLVYISPEKDGKLLPHSSAFARSTNPDYDQWLKRLFQAKVSHLLCLRPACVELMWAETHTNAFRRLAGGSAREWGLFKLNTN
ncbi:MAG: hypothetical protein PHP98_08650 [Kiritimatiellae bacterium]|nr:hypothetical protein [Kiritimatiellia bacterium]